MTQAKREAKLSAAKEMSKRKGGRDGRAGRWAKSSCEEMLACVRAVVMRCTAAAAMPEWKSSELLRDAERVTPLRCSVADLAAAASDARELLGVLQTWLRQNVREQSRRICARNRWLEKLLTGETACGN